MSDLNTEIYNWLDPQFDEEIYYGKLPDDIDFSQGCINYLRITGLGDVVTGTSNASYQFSVRHTNISDAYTLKEKLIKIIFDTYGHSLNDYQLVWFLANEGGELYEDNGRIVHLPVVFNVKYVRKDS